jgi:hypothetical protein
MSDAPQALGEYLTDQQERMISIFERVLKDWSSGRERVGSEGILESDLAEIIGNTVLLALQGQEVSLEQDQIEDKL